MSEFIHGDCLEYMRKMPDNAYDLAIVDPPYGDGKGDDPETRPLRFHGGNRWDKYQPGGEKYPDDGYERFGGIFEKYKRPADEWNEQTAVARTGGTWAAKYGKKIIGWDVAPGKEYFDQLFRVSKNQIIWGGNYFDLPPTRCFVIFRKTNIPVKGFTMSPVEYAWTSFNRNAVIIEASTQGTVNEPRFHPTQKPISLYEDLLFQFANKGDKILDTHVGSGSSLIACYNLGYEYTGFEIDEVYYKKASDRLADTMAQIRMDLSLFN